MREIKFRAWDKNKSKMWSHDMLFRMDCSNEYPFLALIKGYYASGMLDPKDNMDVTVMQYTGLKDKNGKGIYEGDEFHLGDPRITYTVVWHDTGFMGKQNGASSFVGLSHWKNRIEIIGNIYENPELLEQHHDN